MLLLASARFVVGAAPAGGIAWVEDFADDPIAAGRFSVPPGQDASRFTYAAAGPFVTVHYDTQLPTAWYWRLLDATGGRSFGRCDDFEFSVTFHIRGAGFFADASNFAQIGWGLINTQTTGEDRAGGSAGPYAFDVVTFDYFPNITAFGGPNLGATVIHSDSGAGFFAKIDFGFGPETRIDAALGDASIALDTTYTARVSYDSAAQTATLTVTQGSGALPINADGAGGPGGFDGDVTTIQTLLQIDGPFAVDAFALTAWQDTFNPFGSTVIADVDVSRISFTGLPATAGDLNHDGLVDGNDIAAFVDALLSGSPAACAAARGDFDLDGQLTVDDLSGFVAALVGA